MIDQDLRNFDLISYLEDRSIDYGKPGTKDVGKGYIGIECPFPDCSGSGKHLGINQTSKIFKCWICGRKGSMQYLISVLDHCSINHAERVVSAYTSIFIDNESKDMGHPDNLMSRPHTSQILPIEIEKSFPKIHINYLERRNFDAKKIISDYKLKSVYNIGKYRGRIIVPHFVDRRIVTFVARDVTGRSDHDDTCPKYLNCPETESIISVNKTLYNIDSVKDKAILVEGVTDVWRIGKGSIASCTSNITAEQKKILIKRGLKQLFVLYDAESMAIKKAKDICKELSPFMQTELIKLHSGDPADMKPDDVRSLRRDLLGE